MMPVFSPAEFLECLSPTPAGYRAAVTRLSHDPVPGLRPLRVAIAASFRAETLADYLKIEGARRGFNLALWFTPYGQFEIECGHAGSALFAGNPEVVVIATRLEDLVSNLWHQKQPRVAIEQACERAGLLIANVRRYTAASIVVLNYTEPLLPPGGFSRTLGPRQRDSRRNLPRSAGRVPS